MILFCRVSCLNFRATPELLTAVRFGTRVHKQARPLARSLARSLVRSFSCSRTRNETFSNAQNSCGRRNNARTLSCLFFELGNLCEAFSHVVSLRLFQTTPRTTRVRNRFWMATAVLPEINDDNDDLAPYASSFQRDRSLILPLLVLLRSRSSTMSRRAGPRRAVLAGPGLLSFCSLSPFFH